MHRSAIAVATTALSPAVFLATPVGGAAVGGTVTYEIFSDSVPVTDVMYVDDTGRRYLSQVSLPWRTEVSLADAHGPTGTGAQLRADWRPLRGPARWVTMRIYDGPTLLCQSTLDVGNLSCFGNTPHVS